MCKNAFENTVSVVLKFTASPTTILRYRLIESFLVIASALGVLTAWFFNKIKLKKRSCLTHRIYAFQILLISKLYTPQ